jgi:hypothetical protein
MNGAKVNAATIAIAESAVFMERISSMCILWTTRTLDQRRPGVQ